MKNLFLFSKILLLLFLLLLAGETHAQKFKMGDLIGTNIRREDPVKYLGIAGFVREYHDWVIDEGDRYLPTSNGAASFNYPYNTFRWNPGYQGMSFEQFTPFYTNVIANLNEIQTNYKPICADMKFCLPHLSGTGGIPGVGINSQTVKKPYLDIALEFKPVRTNRTGNTSGSQNLVKDSTTTPPTTTKLAYVDNPTKPSSYLWYADWVTQFSKAFATDNTGNLTCFKVADATVSGQNKVGYVEIWNEQDKNWFDVRFTNDTLPNLIKFTAEEYAAMAGMAYDGFSRGAYVLGKKDTTSVVTYPLGVKNTVNGKSKYVFGGLFDIGEAQWKFVSDVNKICNGVAPFDSSFARRSNYATNPMIKFPFDVLNFHHYCDNSVRGLGTTGVAPELDNVAENPMISNKTFKKRLREIRDSTILMFPDGQGGTSKELWLSEFGWDTNLESDERSEQAGLTQEEAQGRWMTRIHLEIATAKWDRAMQFCIRDEITKSTGFGGSANDARYKSSGLIRDRANNYAPKLSYWYMAALRAALANYYYAQELQCFDQSTNSFTFNDSWQYNTPSGTPRIYLFKTTQTNIANGVYPTISSANQDALAVWLPTANSSGGSILTNYKIYFNNFDGTTSTPVTLIKSVPGDPDGTRTALTIQYDGARMKFFVTVPQITELPQYLILGNSSADANLPACPGSVTGKKVSCDAISLKWTIPAGGYDKISVYYYQANAGEAAPAFDMGNPKWKLYSDDLPPTTTEVAIAGLPQMTGTYYIAVIPQKLNKIPATNCVYSVGSAACFGGIPASTITSLNTGEVNDLFNYNDVTFCYPQRAAFAGGWDDNSLSLYVNLVASGSANFYTLQALSLYDDQGIDEIKIYGDADFVNGGEVLLATYRTSRYLEWVSLPLLAQGNWKRLKLERVSPQAFIKRLVLYGYLNTAGYTEPGCCGSGTAIQVGSAASPPKATASVAFGANTTQTGQEIVVKGNFTFDMASLTFDNCTIYMDGTGDVSLAAAGNTATKQLYLKGSTVQGCKTLWRGIKVFPTTQTYVEPNAGGKVSVIRDAEKAFDVQRSSSTATTFLKFDGAVFEKNMYGLFVNDNTCTGCSLLDINPSSVVKGTIFDGTSTQLKPGYPGMTAGTYKPKSVAGMDINKSASLTVGVAGASANVFQQSDYGIISRNTNLTVLNSVFKDILVGSGGTGMGIWGRDGAKLTQTGLGQTNAATFDNVHYGVYITNSSFKVKDNLMTNVQGRGVEVSSATVAANDFNNIENNTILTISNGIYLANNNVKIRVLNNTITNSLDKNVFGIYCGGTSNTGAKTYDVRGNKVTIKSDPSNVNTYGAGILLTNTFSPNAQGNTIQINNYTLSLTPPPGQNNNNGYYPYIYGILETNDKDSRFCSNNITGVNTHGWGLKTESSTGNKYDCNTFNKTGRGLTFLGDCTNTAGSNIVNNSFSNHVWGLYLQANGANVAKIGKQTHSGNDWLNFTGIHPGAVYQGPSPTQGPSLAEIAANQFEVTASDAILGRFYVGPDLTGYTNPVQNSEWFKSTVGTDMACQNPCTSNQINFVSSDGSGNGSVSTNGAEDRDPLIFKDGLYFDVVTGKNKLEHFAEAYQWMIKRNIYREIKTAYGADYPQEYKAFMAQEANTSVGKFQELEQETAKGQETAPELLEALQQVEEQIAQADAAKETEKEHFQQLSSEQQAQWLASNAAAVASDNRGQLWQERNDLHKQIKDKRKQQLKQMKQQNEVLKAEKNCEKYEKQVNRIYLTLLEDEQVLSKSDSATLDQIAALCPFEGGFAVYKARAVLSWQYGWYKPQWFECDKIVEPRGPEGDKSEPITTEFNFQLMPNPTADLFYLQLPEGLEGTSEFRLISATGQIAAQQTLYSTREKISTDRIPAGIYFVEINHKGQRAFRKILINK